MPPPSHAPDFAAIGAFFTAMTALVGLITAVWVSLHRKTSAIQVLVNGNLQRVQQQLAEALNQIQTMQHDLAVTHGITDPDATDAQAALQRAHEVTGQHLPPPPLTDAPPSGGVPDDST